MRFDPHIHPTVRSAAECNNDSIVPVDPASMQLADLPPPTPKKKGVKGVVNIRIYKHSSAFNISQKTEVRRLAAIPEVTSPVFCGGILTLSVL